MSDAGIERAAAVAREYLLSGTAGAVERDLVRVLVDARAADASVTRAIVADQLPDGSWRGGLGATARALLLLRLLGVEGDAVVGGGVAWLRRRRRGQPTYVSGCDRERHARGLCEHFAGGLFAPTASDGDPPVCWFLSARLEDRPAMLALSSMAQAAEAVWELEGQDARLHAAVLRRVVLDRPDLAAPSAVPVPAFLAAARCLLALPGDDAAVWHALVTTLRSQRADGSWPDVDTFVVLDVLLEAARRGYGGPSLDRAIGRAAELLAVTQQPGGGWGRDAPGAGLEAAAFGLPRDVVGLLALRQARSGDAPESIH